MRRYILNFWRNGTLDEVRAMGFSSDAEALSYAETLIAGRDAEVFADEHFVARISGSLASNG